MSNTSLLLYLLALAQIALAAALPLWLTMAPVDTQTEIPYVTTICSTFQYYPSSTSASASTTVASPSAQDVGGATTTTTTAPPSLLTISVVNSHTAAISTTHNSNAGAPSPVSGSLMPGTLAAGATGAIAVPTNWAGIISVNDAQYPISDENSLIEANYQYRAVEQYAIADVDRAISDKTISNGFTLPITCSCNNIGVTGCNKDLFSLSSCPVSTVDGSCPNPLRSDTGASAANSFFAPCQNAAYTYPNDNQANSQNECQDGQIVCCVGSSCPPSYKQSKG
ncbi:hypothetical protein PG993_014176 [Apiospora rasikravindrae]|uniref:Thaumatin-like protein n=1 Tax=Apiospora rasikravindrae TaxID=990691 RepID=A0ABR1RSB4_9PEZI